MEGQEILCEVFLENGEIRLYRDGGSSPPIIGGDTGWVEATDLVRSKDPSAEALFVRRIHSAISLSYASGNPILQQIDPWSLDLQSQVFDDSSAKEMMQEIIRAVQGVQGFGPEPNFS